MKIGESFLPEFDMEIAGTRKVLERIPDDKLAWKCHPKSNTMGWAANHLAAIVGWIEGALTVDVLDVNPPGGEPLTAPNFGTTKEIVELFDANVAKGRQLLASTPDADYFKNWSLASAGQVLMTMPRIAVVRSWVLNHSIHHRGHLCVYLRLNDIPVPALYGPSGDEQPPM